MFSFHLDLHIYLYDPVFFLETRIYMYVDLDIHVGIQLHVWHTHFTRFFPGY